MIWYLNGEFVEKNKALIPITDLGLNRGWGIFEYLRAYRDYGYEPFMVEAHLDRFYKHAGFVCLKIPLGKEELKSVFSKLLKGQEFTTDMGVKILLTGGVSIDGITPPGEPTLAVLLFPAGAYPESYYSRGIGLLTTKSPRIFPELKTTNYLTSMLALEEAHEKGFKDALFCTKAGKILEATRSNFFFFQGETLFTSDEAGILPGVTRSIVLGLAKPDFGVNIGSHQIEKLEEANEAFITSTDKEILPVTKVGKFVIGAGEVGSRTKFLREKFRRFIVEYYQSESHAKDVN